MIIKSFIQELKNLLKCKIYVVVLFILPILTTILLGVELSQEVLTDIPMAVIDRDSSTFSMQLVNSFDQNEAFNVTHYVDTEEQLEELIRNSVVRTAIIIPKDFYNDITLLRSPTVLMVYDGSHMSMTSVAKAKATEILLTYKAGAAIKQLQARLNMSYEEAYNIAQSIQFSNRRLYNPTSSFKDFLSTVLLVGYIQAAIVLIATTSVKEGIYLLKGRKRIGYGLGKILLFTLVGTLSLMICLTMQATIYDIPFRGSMFAVFIMSLALSFAVSACSILISTLIRDGMMALIVGAVLFIPNSLMAGTTWPFMSMPPIYQSFAKYIPFTHYAVNARNIFLKGTTLAGMREDLFFMITFGVICTVLAELVIVLSVQEDSEKELGENELLECI